MFRKVFTVVIVAVFSLFLLAGCSSAGKGTENIFDAKSFVDECRLLMPSSKYKDSDPVECATYFTKAVFVHFGKSDYYESMSDQERETALIEICRILQKYEYCNIEGFITGYDVDMNSHEVTWYIHGLPDAVNIWVMPGY